MEKHPCGHAVWCDGEGVQVVQQGVGTGGGSGCRAGHMRGSRREEGGGGRRGRVMGEQVFACPPREPDIIRIFSDYVSRSLRLWSLVVAPPCPLPSGRAPGVRLVRRRESGRGLGPSLPYVTARLAPQLALAP